jgi:hypothetical protein
MSPALSGIVWLGAFVAAVRQDGVGVPAFQLPLHSTGPNNHGTIGRPAIASTCDALHRSKIIPQPSSRLYSSIESGQKDKLMQIFASDTSNEVVPSTWNKAVHRFFVGDSGPPLVIISIIGFMYARLKLPQSVSTTDATIFLATIMIWWVQEYVFHRVLLHSSFDWIGKTIHKSHHERDYFHVSIDPPALLLAWLFAAHLIFKSFLPMHLCITATIGYAMAGLFYEWSHYIAHTRVKAPPILHDNSLVGWISSLAAKVFSQMRDNHIRHHRVDDNYWYAFSVPAMDDAFGTNPDIKEIKRKME